MTDTIRHLGVQHVGIPADDVAATAAFYEDILGLIRLERPTSSSGVPGAWLDLGNGQMVHIAQRSPDPTLPIQHFALSVADFDSVVADLRQRGVEVQVRSYVPGYGHQAFIRDPSGNILELNELDTPPRGCELPVRPTDS